MPSTRNSNNAICTTMIFICLRWQQQAEQHGLKPYLDLVNPYYQFEIIFLLIMHTISLLNQNRMDESLTVVPLAHRN